MALRPVEKEYQFGSFMAHLAIWSGAALFVLGVAIAPQLIPSMPYGRSLGFLESLILMLPGIGLAASGLALLLIGFIARVVINTANGVHRE